MAEYSDKKVNAKQNEIEIGDLVWYEPPKTKIMNKQEPLRVLSPFKVVQMKGSMIKARSEEDNTVICRNSSCFKLVKNEKGDQNGSKKVNLKDTDNKRTSIPNEIDKKEIEPLRRSSRVSKPVERFQAGTI
ncbi:unnamed protein product [Brachionus calyciflorus]|uniref:Uncharacterized protein n=1 Tax=Brachionus calyciflorus TaxID=104777 RepID=A0A814SIK7_9BILA|nr:unnamed protein product [Brachionus calyciflorus]